MDKIQKFESGQFKSLRVLTDENGEPLFAATDVAKALGYRDAGRIARRLDADEKDTRLVGTPGGEQKLIVITEAGLYKAILGSKIPEAKAFQRWVTHEVLPAIRRDGGYVAASEGDTDEEVLARAVLVAKRTIERQRARIAEAERRATEADAARIEAERHAQDATAAQLMAEAELVEARPKAIFADAVSASDSCILVGVLAKMICQNGVPMGQNRLFAALREQGFLMNVPGRNWNVPTQRAMEMGLFQVKETAITHADGHVTINRTPLVTGKGQLYFVNRFCGGAQATLDEVPVGEDGPFVTEGS